MDVEQRIFEYVEKWKSRCYSKGIPDEVPISIKDKAPSYKLICLALLNNDLKLNSLGYKREYSKYYSQLKKKELFERGCSIQLELFL